MKVALCLSGMPRDIDFTWPFFQKNLLEHYDVDIFGSFWIDELGQDNGHGILDKPYEHFKESHFVDLCKPKMVKYVTLNNEILNAINEINYRKLELAGIEKFRNYRALCMFYMIEQCNRLRREYEFFSQQKYDIVIRCRSDLVMYNKPDFSNIANKIIYMSKYITAPGINDTCWWSDNETANIFSEIFSFFLSFNFRNIKVDRLEPEPMMSILAAINGIKFQWTEDLNAIARFEKNKNKS